MHTSALDQWGDDVFSYQHNPLRCGHCCEKLCQSSRQALGVGQSVSCGHRGCLARVYGWAFKQFLDRVLHTSGRLTAMVEFGSLTPRGGPEEFYIVVSHIGGHYEPARTSVFPYPACMVDIAERLEILMEIKFPRVARYVGGV